MSQSLFGLSFSKETDLIQQYLIHGTYPEYLNVNQKRALRKRAEVFSLTTDSASLLYVGRSGKEKKIVITSEDDQQRKLHTIHEGFGGGHFGRDKTKEKLMKRYYWRSMVEDVSGFIQTCATCQKATKKFDKQAGPLHPIPVTGIWDQVGVDMIGPLPATSSGNRYLITLCDYFSKWGEAVAVKDKSASTVAHFLYGTIARNLHVVRQQYFLTQLKRRLQKMRKFEVEFEYITKVSVPIAMQFLYQSLTGCSADEAVATCSAPTAGGL